VDRYLKLSALALGLAACAVEPQATRAVDGLDPCVVPLTASGPPAQGVPSEDLADPGPHPTWTTQPGPDCHRDLQTTDGHAIHLTYPSHGDPSAGGEGAIAAGPWPVIVFGHANARSECRLFDGYPTLHAHWASWGYVVAAPDMSDLCGKLTHQNLEDRAARMDSTLTALERASTDGSHWLAGRLDLEHPVVAGHSRGGSAAIMLGARDPEVGAVIALQSVDPGRRGLELPNVTTPTLMVTAGLDRDIRFPTGSAIEPLFVGPTTWLRLPEAVHSLTSDTLDPRDSDPEEHLDRAAQIGISAAMSTALLAATGGVSDGNALVRRDTTELRFSHAGAAWLEERWHTRVDLRWSHPDTLLVDDFAPASHGGDGIPQLNLLGKTFATDNLSHVELYAYQPGQSSPRPYLGRSGALQLTAGRQTGSWLTDIDQPVTAETRMQLVLRVPDRAWAPARLEVVVHVEDTGQIEVLRFDPADHMGSGELGVRAVMVDLPVGGPDRMVRSASLELTGGSVQLLRLSLADVAAPAPPADSALGG